MGYSWVVFDGIDCCEYFRTEAQATKRAKELMVAKDCNPSRLFVGRVHHQCKLKGQEWELKDVKHDLTPVK